jgi:phosphoserine phosphatase
VEHAALQFGITRQHVLAACVQVEGGCASDRLIRVPTDELKVVAIRERIGQPIDVAVGNSVHDQAMLEMARHPLCVNPNEDLEQVARERGWPVYWPAGSKRQTEPQS